MRDLVIVGVVLVALVVAAVLTLDDLGLVGYALIFLVIPAVLTTVIRQSAVPARNAPRFQGMKTKSQRGEW